MGDSIRKREEDARRRAESAEAAQRVLEKEIAERKRVEDELRYHLAIEEALVRASRLFTSTDEPDLTQLLGLLGEAVNADHAYIFLSAEQESALSPAHEWYAKEAESRRSRVPRLNPTDFPWLHAQLDKGEPVVVADVDSLSTEPKSEKFLRRTRPSRSILVVPVRSRGQQTIGFLGFEALTTKRSWSDEEVRLLSVVSEMIACYFARKATEDALRAAERDYRALFENAVEGIYRSSLDGHQLRANPALVKLNGYSSEEEMLPAVNDIATEWYVDPHRREEFKCTLEREGTVTDFESEIYRHKTRERIWISETARLVRNAQGVPLYYEGTVQDITARKRAENALREREARLAAVFRAVNDVIVTFDLDETITGVNRAIERVFGYKPEEVRGQPSVVLVTPESAALSRARTVRAWRGESLPALFEVEGVHKNGRRIPLEASASFLYEGNKPVGLVSVLRDISFKKELERQRADFLAMLTHDIKNPMQVILGCSELLSEESLTEEQYALLRRLHSNALTVHSLVTNYLDLSKIESGHLTLRTQPLLINVLLRQVGQQYEAEAERRDLALRFQLQDDLPPVEGDPLALERVFANLLYNAIKFTPGFGQITVHSALRDNSVVVRIADSGPGIAPEELASLFEKYRQAKEVRTTEGAGLGLFIVRALVEAHGGQVEAESIPGQGACFSVFLPVTSFSSRTTV
jgi:PAS domain S-box-containing protein